MTQTAKLYGGSLYELAAEDKLTEVILEQMQQLKAIFRENPEYVSLLKEPSVALEKRKELIEEAFGAQVERYLVSFMKLLCERNIFREFADCCDEYTRRYNAEHGIVEAVVTTAVDLSKEQMQALKEKLEKMSGKRISLVQKTDASVLAGLRVEMDGKQLDGTVKGRLSDVSKKLSEIII